MIDYTLTVVNDLSDTVEVDVDKYFDESDIDAALRAWMAEKYGDDDSTWSAGWDNYSMTANVDGCETFEEITTYQAEQIAKVEDEDVLRAALEEYRDLDQALILIEGGYSHYADVGAYVDDYLENLFGKDVIESLRIYIDDEKLFSDHRSGGNLVETSTGSIYQWHR